MLMNSFDTRKNYSLPRYLLVNNFFYQLVKNFLELLICKISVPGIFDMIDFSKVFCCIAKY